MSSLFVRPRFEGAVIRDPRTRVRLPSSGGKVPDTTYWRRRLRSGDVVPMVGNDPTVAPSAAQPARSDP